MSAGKRLVIEKSKLLDNLDIIKEHAGDSTIIAVLKGNGYGLGLIALAQILREADIHFFAVSELWEALTLREEGIMDDILLLTPPAFAVEAEAIVESSVIATVSSAHSAALLHDAATRTGKRVWAHIKLDTGFGRFGFLSAADAAQVMRKYTSIQYDGVYSHFSCSFGKNLKYSRRQLSLFTQMTDELTRQGFAFSVTHIANSCALLRLPESRLSAVRVGSVLLGRLQVRNQWGFQRIGFLKAPVIELKTLPKGHNVGYANVYKTKKTTRAAVVSAGYRDGFAAEKGRDTFRLIDILSYIYHDLLLFRARRYVMIHGQKAPVIGRVGLVSLVADVTGLTVAEGDETVLDVNPLMIDASLQREYV